MSVSVLADLLEFTRDGEWGSGEPDAGLVEVGIIRGTDFNNVRYGDLSSIPTRYVRSSVVEKKKLRSGDVLIETAGGTKDQPTGRTVFLNDNVLESSEKPLLCASFARFLRVREGSADSCYLFWKLQDEYIREELLPFHVQHTGVARFQYTQFATTHALELPDSLAEQRKIASVLSALDEKIELNRRMNETLEALAQAIFKDWFVSFGPTRRKIAGATDPAAILGGLIPDPAKAEQIAALFPNSFGEDGLPDGWEETSIYDLASITYGAPFASSRFNAQRRGRPLIRIRDLPNHASDIFTDEVHKKEFVIEPGTIVVGMDGEFRARVWQGVPSLMNQRVCAFLPTERKDRAYTYFSILPQLRAHEQSAIGTTVIHLGKKEIDTFTALQPGRTLMDPFSEIAEPMLELSVSGGLENRSLAETRDYLLPKLMSGAVRVQDVEKAVP